MQRDIPNNNTDDFNFNVKGKKFAVAVSAFNYDITFKMKDGAIETLKRFGATDNDITTVVVPGSFEIPLASLRLAKSKKYDGIIAIGCVIKGDTDHYFYVAGEASRGIMNVMLETGIPIGFGIITVNDLEQAEARSSGNANKGVEATLALLQMLSVFDDNQI